MYHITKATQTAKAAPTEADLAKINQYTRRELAAEEVYIFSVRACDDQPDRDFERFTAECLTGLKELYIGKTVIFDHCWSAMNQTARIFDAAVVEENGETYLRVDAYMLKTEKNQKLTDAIDGGILKEVSVGCAVKTVKCSICGELYRGCEHRKGHMYDDKLCICELSEPTDAYEVSFVAVPAQPKAGIQKTAEDCRTMSINDVDRAKAQVIIEKLRFGG